MRTPYGKILTKHSFLKLALSFRDYASLFASKRREKNLNL
jgi:hypothetical protein